MSGLSSESSPPGGARMKTPGLFVCRYDDSAASCPDWLTEAERDYWGSFSSDRRRASFVSSRGLARTALMLTAGGAFSEWALSAPGVPRVKGSTDWQLSLSHSGERALVGLWNRGALGVDLEPLDPGRHWRAVARRWFHDREIDWLDTLDDGAGMRGFYLLWTLKEAWIKATGRGIAHHLQSLRVLPANPDGWRVFGDRGCGWRCAAGWWEQRCLAVVWQGGPDSPPPSLEEIIRRESNRAGSVESRTQPVDWVIDTEVIDEQS